jgi:sugar phosphate isomerase/epimerase
MNRRTFVERTSMTAAGISLLGLSACGKKTTEISSSDSTEIMNESASLFFKISLAQWSLHSQIREGRIGFLDFAKKGRQFEVEALEYVSQLFPDGKFSDKILKEVNLRADDHGLKNHLIMIDHNGDLAVLDDALRAEAVNNHKAWIEAAASIGCSSIRVNMKGNGTVQETIDYGAESMANLCEYARQFEMNVIIENHGGFSSNIDELVKLFEKVDMENCGALPDFGNWCLERKDGKCIKEYDRYKGMELLMPYARDGVSAKAISFDEEGNEVGTDYSRVLKTVKDAGFNGYIGIEYENDDPDKEDEGILMTKELLIREGSKLS